MFMIQGYLKIALRNLRRNWLFTTINIIGLAIGITSSVLIILYILDEYSYDRFHKDSERIYRVNVKAKVTGQEIAAATTCPPMAAALIEEFLEIEEAARLGLWRETPVIFEEKAFTEDFILLADSNFFEFFDYKLIAGNPVNTLSGPNKIVLSQEMALKYFGSLDARKILGKQIDIGTERFSCEIVGIVENAPTNTHIPYDMIMSLATWPAIESGQWISNFMYTYFKLRANTEISKTKELFNQLVIKYVGPEAEVVFGMSLQDYQRNADFSYGYDATCITDIHLRSKLTGEMKAAGNIQYTYIFMLIALFIILIALINFINLFTAQSGKKAREVGIRKTVGALKEKLVAQFMIESILHALIALILAGALIHLTIDAFNAVAQKSVEFNAFKQPLIIPGLLILAIFIGLMAGVYPSFFLSSFRPVSVLRGEVSLTGKRSRLRRILVIIQFAISTGLILSSLVMYKQLTFLQEQNLGFDKERVLVIRNGWSLKERKEVFKNELMEFPFVKGASIVTNMPPYVLNSGLFRPVGGLDDHLLHYYWADEDHLDVMDVEMKEGRFYSKDFPSDSLAIVVNEEAIQRFGWDSFENQKIVDYMGDTAVSRNVIGVVRNFNYVSLHESIQPLAILIGDFGNLVTIKLDEGNYKEMIQQISVTWKHNSEGAPFDFYFLDDQYNSLYKAEERTSNVILIFTCLAIIVASLGLFGLATYAAERRTHEIGVRKVMGASATDIITLLNRDFLKLVIYGMLISVPVTIFFIQRWFRGFSYHIDLSWDLFLITAIIAFVLALLTVSIRAIRAASINPVDAIKVE